MQAKVAMSSGTVEMVDPLNACCLLLVKSMGSTTFRCFCDLFLFSFEWLRTRTGRGPSVRVKKLYR